MGSQKRIAKELSELVESPPPGIKVELADESDIYKWKVYMDGPEDSPYQGGTFLINLTLPTAYPFKPPTISFGTKIYHPNVTNDDKGSMCLGMLKSDEWKPSSRISSVLEFARQLLSEPMPDDAVEGRIAEQYKNDRSKFNEVASEWTKQYANAK
ncbi:ubiquitin conjugating enzyme (UbcB), putative [Paecilomyces variotii No. 5]|uniref:E2 ubiquitin-conjugating enzyme n=1 Tax=Byssochlamys spectabilis (strain No. 5 / NBRC 109023) TaxID=1356009 RepID=V5G429_BYSSN|nr:ubiquitin conjugating enzyme (UbcB), putative [Paecilomyces variotii No. 5]